MKTLSKIFILLLFVLPFEIFGQDEEYDSSDLYLEAAKNEVQNQNYTKAARLSWKGLKLAPNDLDLKTINGKANLELGRYDTARYVLKQVYDRRPKNISILQYLVNIEQTTKRYSDAICFVNELLEITPYSRGWWMRKITIYKEMGNYEEAERALKRLYQIYPEDTEIQQNYNYIMLEDGNDAIKNRNFEGANEVYKTVITNDPTNKDAYIGIIRNELLKGNPEYALQFTERALLQLPKDRELIDKKIGLLEQLGRHEEAIVYIKTSDDIKENYPDIIKTTLPYLMQQSADFNEYNDPYEINKKLTEVGGNSQALDYVINNAMGKGYYIDAEYFIKKALNRSPNSKKYLVKQMELYKATQDWENYEKSVLENHEKFPNDTDITYAYEKVMYDRAKNYVLNQRYSEALTIFEELTSSPDFTKEAELQIFGIYSAQQRLDEAQDQIDKLIQLDPNNPDYLLRKSTLYQAMDLYEDALQITRDLEAQYPLEEKYSRVYVSQVEAYARYLMKEQRYKAVLPIVEDGLTRENNNQQLLNIAINASSAIPDYERGIEYGQSALSFYPNNKDFKLKLSNMYFLNKEYEKSQNILDSLKVTYKYDRRVKNALAEILFFRAKQQEEDGLIEESLASYDSALALNPNDEASLMRLVNLHIVQKPNDESLEFINAKLEDDPNNSFLKYKKGIVFELMKEYDSAYYYQKFREIDDPYEKERWNETLEILRAAKLKNRIAATYTQASSDSIAFSTSLANLSYNHKYDSKNTFGADLNYAARSSGVGVQGGVNYSRVFTPTLYADAGILLGSRFFPKMILYGTAYKGLKNGYGVDAGLRYSLLQNDVSFIALNLGASKTWEDVWLGAKLSLMRDDQFNYFNVGVQSRINVNPRKDYVSFIVSGGSAPFDQQLPEGQAAFLSFSNVLIGAGYLYNISPRTALLVNGTWINFQNSIETTTGLQFINQYNLSVTIITNF